MCERNAKPPVSAAISRPRETLPLGQVGWVFLHIGAVAFGGLGAGLALIERELVEKRRLLTSADVTEALTYTKLLPGSTLIQVVAYVGFKLRGWPGSALATAAFVLPSAVMMLLMAVLYQSASGLPRIGPAVNGLTAAVAGLLLAATYRFGKANIKEPVTAVLAASAFVTAQLFSVHAAVIVLVAGLVGLVLLSRSAPEKAR